MRFGDGLRFVAALLLLGLVGIVAVGAFGAGYSAGSAEGATHVSAWAHDGWFGAGHLLGFLITILILIIVIRLIVLAVFGHSRHGWHGHHGHWHGSYWGGDCDPSQSGPGDGPGGWHRSDRHRGDWREAGQAMFDDFHRRAHGTEPPASGGEPAKPGTR